VDHVGGSGTEQSISDSSIGRGNHAARGSRLSPANQGFDIAGIDFERSGERLFRLPVCIIGVFGPRRFKLLEASGEDLCHIGLCGGLYTVAGHPENPQDDDSVE
jgi:hypothetical protein